MILLSRLSAVHGLAPFAEKHSAQLLFVLGFECAYVAVKSFAWMVAYNDAGIPLGWKDSLRLFLISCFLDAVSFPTVLAGDGFKLVYLKSYGAARVLRAIVSLRSGALLAYFLVAGCLLSWGLGSIAVTLIAIVGIPPLVIGVLSRQRADISWTTSLRVLRQALLNSVALSVDGIRFLILASIAGLVPSFYAAGSFIVSQLGGLITGIPFGLGGREATLALLLHNSLDLAQLSLILVGLRCTGELPAALTGWLLAGKEVWQWRRSNTIGQ